MRTALVTGANRGLGREIVRRLALQGYRVLLTARDVHQGEQVVHELEKETGSSLPGRILFHPLDVTDAGSIQRMHAFVVAKFTALDVLVNNAAVLLDQFGRILQTPPEIYRLTMETNVFGPLRLCQAFIPLMLAHGYGRVVNVSSGAGQVEEMVNDMTAYRLSKIALNGLTRMLADSVKGSNVLVNAGCPGWMRTDMGSLEAPLSAAEGAEGIVWLATLPDGGPSGGFFRHQEPIPW